MTYNLLACVFIKDRYGNKLSFWQSLRRRLWSLQYQKQYRSKEIKYGYDFDYRRALYKTLDSQKISSDVYRNILKNKQIREMIVDRWYE